MNVKILTLAALSSAVLVACDSTTLISPDSAGSRPSGSNSAADVNVFDDFIAPSRRTPKAAAHTANLFSNSGFEDGLSGWEECSPGSIEASSEAYSGDGAVKVNKAGCFYRSVEVTAGDTYTLSCHVKLQDQKDWTGMGLVFADSNYHQLSQAPVAIATSTSYMQVSTSSVAPEGVSFASMWLYSDPGAIVDNCLLTVEPAEPVEPTPPTANEINLMAQTWAIGCAGNGTADSGTINVKGGTCADQTLAQSAIRQIETAPATFSCLVADTSGYSDMSFFLNGTLVNVQQITSSDIGSRVSVTVPAQKAANGFLSTYSEGNLTLQDCTLAVGNNGTGTTVPAAPVDPAPVDPAPVDPAPVDPAPVDPAPVDPAPVDPAPVDPAPVDPAPVDPAPVDLAPVDPAPVDPAPVDPAPVDPVTPAPSTAVYRLTFNSTWSQATHPTQFPGFDPHFSPLVGGTHSSQVSFWATGQLASDGIELMAETGNASGLLAEVSNAISQGTADAEIFGGPIPLSPGSTSIEFEVSQDFPMLTLTSMIAPSPDWFIGVNSFPLFDGQAFIDNATVDLRVYDSGTDNGVTFTSGDSDTSPAAPISRLTSASTDSDFVNGLPTIGQFIIERIQ